MTQGTESDVPDNIPDKIQRQESRGLPEPFLETASRERRPRAPRAFLVKSVHEASQAETPGIELRHSGGLPLRPAIQRPAAGVSSGGGGKTYSRRLVGKDIYARTSGRRGLCAAAGERRHP